MKTRQIICLILVFTFSYINAQTNSGLRFVDASQRKMNIKFEMVNNLIVIPVILNGVPLSFLLDTGVEQTLLFVQDSYDTELLQKTKKVNVRGLGEQDEFEAYQSLGNHLQIEDAENSNQEIIFLVDKDYTLTSRLGLPINGIIGYDFFNNFIVRINYPAKKITLFNPNQFNKKLRNYEELPFRFYRKKPYVNLKVNDTTVTTSNLNFLVDTGSGSTFWLLEGEHVRLPDVYFDDVLGYGISSPIFGKRSRINQINFGNYKFNDINIAYPDVEQIYQIEQNVLRNGTLGAEILKRFKLYFDYGNRKIYFKANSSLNNPFNYDMSGLSLKYDGLTLVKEYKVIPMKMNTSQSTKSEYNSSFSDQSTVSLMIKQKLIIDAVRLSSPAAEAGILPGDELVKINRNMVYNLSLNEIQTILSEEEGKTVKLKIKRNQEIISKTIQLRDRLEDLIKKAKK